jgi:hypothetical protein
MAIVTNDVEKVIERKPIALKDFENNNAESWL